MSLQGEGLLVLQLQTHHSIMDGTSLQVLLQDLGATYDGLTHRQQARLPEQSIQYSDYAHWQREQQAAGGWDEHVRFWKENLAGAPDVLDLPADVSDEGQKSSTDSHWLEFQLEPRVMAGLRALATRCQASLLALLIAALQVRARTQLKYRSHIHNLSTLEKLKYCCGSTRQALPFFLQTNHDCDYGEIKWIPCQALITGMCLDFPVIPANLPREELNWCSCIQCKPPR